MSAHTVNLIFRTVVLKPGETRSIAQAGAVFFCKSATAVFGLSIDGNQEIDFDAGWQLAIAPSNWKSLFLHNYSATDNCTITYYLGSSTVAYASQTLTFFSKLAPTTPLGNVITIAAGQTLTFNGVNGTQVRKQIIFANCDPGAGLDVLDGNGTQMGYVFASTSWTVECSGTIKLKNNNAGAVAIRVGEIFYT